MYMKYCYFGPFSCDTLTKIKNINGTSNLKQIKLPLLTTKSGPWILVVLSFKSYIDLIDWCILTVCMLLRTCYNYVHGIICYFGPFSCDTLKKKN